MKVLLTTAFFALSTVPMLAQAGETGVSHPDQAPITSDSDAAQQPKAINPAVAVAAKPSAYVPYSVTPNTVAAPRAAGLNPDAEIVTTNASDAAQTDGVYQPYKPYKGAASEGLKTHEDVDAGIVTDVPWKDGEMPEGTLLRVRMNDSISTKSTVLGSPFSATLSDDVQRDGKTILPMGSVVYGQVTEIRGGKRISGRAAIHLEPRRVMLPDGTYYSLHAQLVDTGEENQVRVTGEGTLVRRDHAKETLAVMSLSTGSAAVAGAMIGGGVGAVIGAGIGAGAGTVLWLKQDRQAALPKDTAMTFSLTTPMMMRPLRDGAGLRP